ncbi:MULTISPECIES: septation protein SepH [Corynebacterium]|uniref:septation protein SepH n=1 Tax=Corynebacterium TaxID=1716 RepID=UPI001E5519B6|nr:MULTISPECIES: septation protein SepH [Corynebacterium]
MSPLILEVLFVKELKLVVSESDSSSLVLALASATEGSSDESPAEDFYLPVTQELRDVLEGIAGTERDAAEGELGVDDNNDNDADSTPTHEDSPAAEPAATSRPRRTHLSIRPRAIQERLRQGATIAELAEEADTDESTIEPYAWPILQERALVAETAHSAHPIVEAEGGPSKQTLWEVLATALAARGESLNDCEWDAHQDASRQWFVTVSWNKSTAGQTARHVAEFRFDRHQGEPQIIEPHNSLAADLVDPRYGRPVRTLAPVEEVDFAAELDEPAPSAIPGAQPAEQNQGEHFLQNPPAQPSEREKKKRRKAVTPHWEDVLLGVRTNPKKK